MSSTHSYSPRSYEKHRNTIFCNPMRFDAFERCETKGATTVEHSLYVPLNTIYYVDNEGFLSVYQIPEEDAGE